MQEFSSVTEKQWKQRVQYELLGKEYNTVLKSSHQGIAVNPLYTDGGRYPFSVRVVPQMGVQLYVTTLEKLESELRFWRSNQVRIFRLRLHNKAMYELVLSVLSPSDYYFIEVISFEKELLYRLECQVRLLGLQVLFVWDGLGNFSRTGNWYRSKKQDLSDIKAYFSDSSRAMYIDASLFQQSGGSVVQQLAYALLMFVSYGKYAQQWAEKIYIRVAVEENVFFEIAKLRAFRQAFESVFAYLGISASLQLWAIPSQLNWTLYAPERNVQKLNISLQNAIWGGVDAIFPMQAEFYKRERRSLLWVVAQELSKKIKNVGDFPVEGCFYTDHLTAEITQKSLKLFEELSEQTYVEALEKNIIQRKIQESFSKRSTHYKPFDFVGEHQWEILPFTKRQPRKTLIPPILPRRVSEKTEREIYREIKNPT